MSYFRSCNGCHGFVFQFAVLRTKFLWKLGNDVSGVVIGPSWMRIVAMEVVLGHDRWFSI